MTPEKNSVQTTTGAPLRNERLHNFLRAAFIKATAISTHTSNMDSIEGNCSYNACALDTVLSKLGVDSRVIRGAVIQNDDPYPSETAYSLNEYIGEFGTGHWWVEAKLTPNTWWTVDMWSIHPDRTSQPLVLSGRPDEYVVESINPDGQHWYSP